MNPFIDNRAKEIIDETTEKLAATCKPEDLKDEIIFSLAFGRAVLEAKLKVKEKHEN